MKRFLRIIPIALIIAMLFTTFVPAQPVYAATAVDEQISIATDDAKAHWDGGAWNFTHGASSTLAGYWGATNYKIRSGMSFQTVAVPQGARIITAQLVFTAQYTNSCSGVNTKIRGEDADDAATFSDYANFDGRSRTTATVTWNEIGAWTAESVYRSPELKTIIQEIVDRGGWSSGNDMVIFWGDPDDQSTHTDETVRRAYAYDGVPAKAAQLHIEYVSVPAVITNTPTNVGVDDARLNGELIELAGYSSVYVYFQYGLTEAYGSTTTEQARTTLGRFDATVISLDTNSEYHYRSVVKYDASYAYGEDRTFKTGAAWLTGYDYRQLINVTGSTEGSLQNYTVRLSTHRNYASSFPEVWSKNFQENPITSTQEEALPCSMVYDNGTYYIYFENKHGTSYHKVDVATSTDLKNWTPYSGNPVLDWGTSGQWDDTWIGMPMAWKEGSQWYMMYEGNPGAGEGGSDIGLAYSTDGYNWTKEGTNPVIVQGGAGGGWEGTNIGTPRTIKISNTYYCFYTGAVNPGATGLATSTNLLNWTKEPTNPVLESTAGTWDAVSCAINTVTAIDGKYYATYCGRPSYPGEADWAVGLASSSNLIDWTKNPNNPILCPGEEGTWEQLNIKKHVVWNIDGQWTMLYMANTSEPGNYRMGLAYAADINLGYNVRSDFADVRFTDADGATPLNYWMEDMAAGDCATFWIELDSVSAYPSNTSFYIYYGKTTDTTTSDGETTFPFFDTFPGSSLDATKWTGDTGDATVAGSILTYSTAVAAWESIHTMYEYDNSYALRVSANLNPANEFKGVGTSLNLQGSGFMARLYMDTGGNKWIQVYTDGGSWHEDVLLDTADTYHVYELRLESNKLYYNRDNLKWEVNGWPLLHGFTKTNATWISINDATIKFDWIIVRPFADPEPLVTVYTPTIVVTTNSASDITNNSATLQGTLTDDGEQTCSVRFQWGTTTSYGNDTTWQGGKTAGNDFNQPITGLDPNTTYYFRAQAKWADGTTVSGNTQSFPTSTLGTPSVTTNNAVDETGTTATLQGTLTSLGDYSPVYVSFEWGLTTGYGTPTTERTMTSTSGFNKGIEGLDPGITYHFRARVRYNGTYMPGADKTFVTPTAGEPGIDPPDVLRIDDIKVFSGYFEPNDQLYVIAYRIIYNSGTPILDVTDYFDFQLLDGATLKAQVPVKMWDYRPGCIYLIADSAPAWGGSYRIKIIGAPDKWETPPEAYRDLTPGDWQGSDLAQLDTWVLSLAESFQSYYTIEYVIHFGSQTVLSSEGGARFNIGIPGLSTVRPNLFSASSEYIQPIPQEHGTAGQEVIDPEERIGPQVFEMVEAAADFFNMETTTLGGFAVAIVYVLIALGIGGAGVTTGHSVAGLFIAVPLIIAGAWVGLIPLALIMIASSILVMYTIYAIWVRGT